MATNNTGAGGGGEGLAGLPKEPVQNPMLGFLHFPPYRVQGISIAGEETVVQVPELDLCFDIGRCPRAALASNLVALTHGHMDHSAGIAYYFSQRNFQGLEGGAIVCHPGLEGPIHNVMRAWVDLEAQRTPYKVIALAPESELEIKNHLYLRAFSTVHTASSLGFLVIERRSKLRPELMGMPQEKLLELKNQGQEITHALEVPVMCYTGDTMWGKHFDRADVLAARILIVECTFMEAGHRGRATVGQHLHLDDVVELLKRSKAEAVVLTHLSRRTHIAEARKRIEETISAADRARVHLLMDGRGSRGSRGERGRADRGQ